MAEKQSILTPTGRVIWGDAYEPETTNMQGQPLLIKSGPNAGKARVNYAIGLAIPKTKAAWWEEVSIVKGQPYPWGQIILTEGQKGFPNGAWQRKDFSWKVIDGDSTDFNQGNPPKRFCDIPNYKGHWVLKFSSGFAPNIVNENGTAEIIQPGHVYAGCYVQIFGNIEGNGNDTKPGLYLNLQTISFQAHGARIVVGPDAATLGFGGGPLPAGASTTPVGGMSLQQAEQTAMGGMPMPGAAQGTVGVGMPGLPTPTLPQTPAPLAVTPNTGFTTLPGVGGVPGGAAQGIPQLPGAGVPNVPGVPIPGAIVQPQRILTAKAQGATYEQLIANGWTDEILRAQGVMI